MMNLSLIFKRAAILPVVLVMVGCASQEQLEQRISTRSVAVLGVTLAADVKSGRSQSSMVRELEQLARAEAGYQTLPSHVVDKALEAVSPGSFDVILKNFAGSGQLSSRDIQALQSARLPVRTVLIARVEKNEVRPGAPKRMEVRNNAGRLLSDRQRVILSTTREMQVRASMIDVANGQVIWSKAYRATPSAESSYVLYSGSSFSGSLAASFANTISNGLTLPSGPLPPSNQITLRSLLREVVRNLPKR